MSQKSKTMPGIGQYFLGFILGALAITAGCISLAMNYAYGIQTSAFMAAAFVISDCAKMILPMTSAALGGWDHIRKAGYAVALIMSVLAAVSYLLESQASRLIASQSAQQTVTTARADAERIRQELTTITEMLSVASLEKLAHSKDAAAKREAGRGGCGRSCEALITEHARHLERLGQAKRRDALEAQLAEIDRTLSKTKVTAIGAANNCKSQDLI